MAREWRAVGVRGASGLRPPHLTAAAVARPSAVLQLGSCSCAALPRATVRVGRPPGGWGPARGRRVEPPRSRLRIRRPPRIRRGPRSLRGGAESSRRGSVDAPVRRRLGPGRAPGLTRRGAGVRLGGDAACAQRPCGAVWERDCESAGCGGGDGGGRWVGLRGVLLYI